MPGDRGEAHLRQTVDRYRQALGRLAWEVERQARLRVRIGRRVECPICSWTGPAFCPSRSPRRPNRLCPSCGSSERDRAIELTLKGLEPAKRGARVLEMSPIGTLERTAERLGYEHTGVNIRLTDPRADVFMDLCATPFADGSFDLAVCLHVLEHIIDDRTAARELARILAPGGQAIVIVPFYETLAETYEVPGADPSEYKALYGQSDHVRKYGTDVTARWRAAGLTVTEELWSDRFTLEQRTTAALDGPDDRFWIITPTPEADRVRDQAESVDSGAGNGR